MKAKTITLGVAILSSAVLPSGIAHAAASYSVTCGDWSAESFTGTTSVLDRSCLLIDPQSGKFAAQVQVVNDSQSTVHLGLDEAVFSDKSYTSAYATQECGWFQEQNQPIAVQPNHVARCTTTWLGGPVSSIVPLSGGVKDYDDNFAISGNYFIYTG